MVYAFESDVKVDDDILKAELGANGDVQLKNIVRTIQKEQNAIIRNTSDRILVIQGVAGSGKTSVALHRIAYLLYHDRKNLKSSNVLILFAKWCIFRLYFPYFTGTGRRKYSGNEF